MKIINRLLALVVVSAGVSCHNEIELTPFSQANTYDFFQDANDFENAVNATYDVIQDGRLYGSDFELLLEVRSDNGAFNDPASNAGEPFSIDKFVVTPSNSLVRDAYVALYQGVQRSNAVLSRIDDVNFDETLKSQFKGETLFLRALFYFHLVQLYGDIPLITSDIGVEEARELTRDPVSDIYMQIEEDLAAAVGLLPASYDASQTGRVTSWAASGLLAKVFLTRRKFGQAQRELERVINSSEFALLDRIADVFATSNEHNEEIVFAVRYRKGEGGEGHGLIFGYTQNPTIDEDLVNAYDPADDRLSLVQYLPSSGGINVPGKYFDVLSESNNSGNDIPVIRYADILLMYAEVLNELEYVADENGAAFVSLNAVRTRAGLAALTPAELPNQLTFRNAVYNERRLELALEFHRWYDLKRTGTAIRTMELLGLSIQECLLVYPIPQMEIDVFNNPDQFPQNDCYN